jgi:hypothetical protein
MVDAEGHPILDRNETRILCMLGRSSTVFRVGEEIPVAAHFHDSRGCSST